MTKEKAVLCLSALGVDEEGIQEIEEAFSQEPQFFPPCKHCNEKMDSIRRAYDNIRKEKHDNIE